MRASVIIPAFNAASTVTRCLAALESQSLPRREYKVIVADDGSTDATKKLVASFINVKCVSVPHLGAAAARNRGAAWAEGDVLLFTDADCEPQPDWIEKMLAVFSDASVVGAKGTYRTRDRRPIARFVQVEYEEKYERMRETERIDFVDTYSAAYRHDVFTANGGFDESFPTASVEDQEFSFRLASQGYRLVFVPDAIVFHPHDGTLAAYVRRKFLIGYWKIHLHMRHPGKVWSDSHTPQTQKFQILIFLLALASLAALPFFSSAAALLIASIAAFVASALPLTVFAAQRDRPIALIAPAMIFARAAALAFGLLVGIGAEATRIVQRKLS